MANVTKTKASDRLKEETVIQLIVFNLGDEEFAVGIGEIREIIRTGVITPIPDSPAYIRGVSNVRGEIAAVIDLKKRFSLPKKKGEESRHIVIREQDENVFGLMVDEVTEVLRIPEEEIKHAPDAVTKAHGEYVKGVVTINNRLIIMLDLVKVLSEHELEKLSDLKDAYAASPDDAQDGQPENPKKAKNE
jgi:purine-binding chemotaxis protein CheW